MSDRYQRLFERLRARGEGAFIPFVVLGDPDRATSAALIEALIAAGADALELGLPFSDPVADGPVIQAADLRALKAGVRADDAWELIARVRAAHPALPIGLLVYANLVETRSEAPFYRQAAEAGVDSVLIADVPTLEAEPYARAARSEGVLPVLIATPTATDEHLADVARLSEGYIYVVTRKGVTGAEVEAPVPHGGLLQRLAALGGAPPILGFGISRPEHVRAALAGGAAGVISGSAVVQQIADNLEHLPTLLARLSAFVARMKAATHASRAP
jgi:tryptophan synthase alpha chain